MEQKNLDTPESKDTSFRLKTEKYSYGKLLLIFMLLGGIFNTYQDNLIPAHSLSHTTSIVVALLFALIEITLNTGMLYFLTLWIMSLIRRRGKIDRPESKKAKLIVNIIFGLIFLMMLTSVGLSMYRASANRNADITPEQSTFISAVTEKSKDFTVESDKVKIATQGFIDVINNQEWSKMHDALEGVVSATAALQPKIDELKVFSENSKSIFTGEKDKQVAVLYARAIDVRDRDNKKLSELATYGLTIDWNDPTEAEMTKWQSLAEELSVIEKELQATQAEFQMAAQS